MTRALLLAVLLLVPAASSAALSIPSPPTRRVNDYAGALSATDRDRLEQKLLDRERTSSNQVVVGIFRSLEGESLEDFSIRLAQAWRIGQKGLDNGVIFLVFLDDRRMRLEVGYGLEGVLTDAVSSSILQTAVAPRFREGKVADGIAAGLDAIDQAIAGTYAAKPGPRAGSNEGVPLLAVALFVGVGVAVAASAMMARTADLQRRRGLTTARRDSDDRGRSNWPWIIGPPGGFGGGGFGGGGFGGGGFGGSSGGGGFSGGGGGFGGGGSSGSW